MKKEKMGFKGFAFILLYGFLGGVIGYIVASTVLSGGDGSISSLLIRLAVTVVLIYVLIMLHVICHEAGHLVCGLLSGYSFSSFRIGSFMIMKSGGKLITKRLTIPGTAGQCLLIPPPLKDGKMPFVLYNLGGVLANLALTAMCLGAALLSENAVIRGILYCSAAAGLVLAISNGVPSKTGTVANDGYNILMCRKSGEAVKSLWIQLMISAKMTVEGARLNELPSEWFYMPEESELKNAVTASMAVFYENRLMDEHRFREAGETIDRLFSVDTGILGVYRAMLVCDRIYCELMGDSKREIVEKLLTKEQKTFMKQMKTQISVIRTQYALALLYESDGQKAEKLLATFTKAEKYHPMKGDIESERELVELASRRADMKT